MGVGRRGKGSTLIFCTVVIVAAVKNSDDGRLFIGAGMGGAGIATRSKGLFSASSQRLSFSTPPAILSSPVPSTRIKLS